MVKKRAKKTPDPNSFAAGVMNDLLSRIDPEGPPVAPADTSGKNPAAVALGRLGGLKGGPARAARLSARQRTAAAKKAAAARWGKKRSK